MVARQPPSTGFGIQGNKEVTAPPPPAGLPNTPKENSPEEMKFS